VSCFKLHKWNICFKQKYKL